MSEERSVQRYVSTAMNESNKVVAKKDKHKSGDNSGEVTPVPISNTEVKLLSADDTWREAAWKSRTLPVIFGSMVKRSRHRPFTAVTRVRFSVESPKIYARLAELADALDLGSSGRPWGFESPPSHQTETGDYLRLAN
jgi:hypothetical protein